MRARGGSQRQVRTLGAGGNAAGLGGVQKKSQIGQIETHGRVKVA